MKTLCKAMISFGCLFILASCGGGGGGTVGNPPANVGGGYTLEVSGGTLNDGSEANGLVVLATLRNSQGYGPAIPWTISITGPGISSNNPIVVDYNNGLPGSYLSWEWGGIEPVSGTYRATATDGTVSIHYDFTINSSGIMARPSPSASSSTTTSVNINWSAVSGATSYHYEIVSPSSEVISGFTTTSTSALADFGSTLATGDYLVRVRAYATNRVALDASRSSSPSLSSQENVSEYSFTLPVGGNQDSSKYSFSAVGGVMDYGLSGPGGPIYGFAIWTSLLDTTSNPSFTAPAGNWNIKIIDQSTGAEIANYIYPAGSTHYIYWYYGIEPQALKTYTITATYGLAQKTTTFTFSDTTPALALPTGISATPVSSHGDEDIAWNPVAGAGSYYVNIWADVWNSSTHQYEYTEVWNQWVNSSITNVSVPAASLEIGVTYDVFVSASKVDMTAAMPPSPARADMSENYLGASFTQ